MLDYTINSKGLQYFDTLREGELAKNGVLSDDELDNAGGGCYNGGRLAVSTGPFCAYRECRSVLGKGSALCGEAVRKTTKTK